MNEKIELLQKFFQQESAGYTVDDVNDAVVSLFEAGGKLDAASSFIKELKAPYFEKIHAIQAAGGPKMHEKLFEANFEMAVKFKMLFDHEQDSEKTMEAVIGKKTGDAAIADQKAEDVFANTLNVFMHLSQSVATKNNVDVDAAQERVMDPIRKAIEAASPDTAGKSFNNAAGGILNPPPELRTPEPPGGTLLTPPPKP